MVDRFKKLKRIARLRKMGAQGRTAPKTPDFYDPAPSRDLYPEVRLAENMQPPPTEDEVFPIEPERMEPDPGGQGL